MKTYEEFKKQFEEELSVSTGSVAGAGNDSSTVVIRKKGDRKNKRKDNVAVLRRLLPNKNI